MRAEVMLALCQVIDGVLKIVEGTADIILISYENDCHLISGGRRAARDVNGTTHNIMSKYRREKQQMAISRVIV